MRDPHVASLEYEIKTGGLFDNPPPVLWKTHLFKANLTGGLLLIELCKHFATEEEARAEIDPLLEAWEIDVALQFGWREITFVFKESHIVDRDPSARDSVSTATATVKLGRPSITATGQVIRRSYPAPPSNFTASPDVVTLWTRFEGYKKGREPLLTMAYFCLTLLEYNYGGGQNAARTAASKALAIDVRVLKKLGDLTSNRGEPSSARKMSAGLTSLTTAEAHWLDATIRILIRRVGEIADGRSPPELTMKQLPPISAGRSSLNYCRNSIRALKRAETQS